MQRYCKKCRHIRKITGNKKAKCLSCGLPELAGKMLQLRDKDKLKLIRLEMQFK